MEKITDLELIELSKTNLRRTFDEIQDRASSIILLNLKWKDMENVLDSAQSSVEDRFKEVKLKEDDLNQHAMKLEREFGIREKSVKDQFEEVKVKEEELESQRRDLELEKRSYEESLKEFELKRMNQVEEFKLKEEEFLLKKKGFEKYCRDFELEKKDLEQSRINLRFSVEQCKQQFRECERQCKEVKVMEKLVKDKLEDVQRREGEVELKEKDLVKRFRECELKGKGLEARRKGIEVREKQSEQKCDEVKLMENLTKQQLEVIQRKENDFELRRKDFEDRYREFELKQGQFGLKEESFGKRCMEFELEEKAFEELRKDLEFNVKKYEHEFERVQKQLVEVKRKDEGIGLKEKQLEQRMREFELKEKVFEERYEVLVANEKHCTEEFRKISLETRNLEQSIEELKKKSEDVKVKAESVQDLKEEFKKKMDELGLKERELKKRCRDVELSESRLQKDLHDLELKSKQYEERFNELKLNEKAMNNQFEELKKKEEQFGLKNQCSRDFKLKERSLENGYRDLEAKQQQYEECLREFKLKEKQIEESSEQLRTKYGLQFKDLELKVNQYDQKFTELKQLEESSKQMMSKYNMQFNDLELKVKQYDQKFKELKLKENLIKDQFEKMELKERHLDQCSKDFDLKEKGIEQRYQELEAKEKDYDECLRKVKLREQSKDLELKEKKLEEWSKELESKKRRLDYVLHPQVKTEAADRSVDHSSPAHLRFCINMVGKDLQIFLNERWKEHGSMGTEVAMALQLSSDPAKLVLDAMEGFYPPHLSKGGIMFEGNVVRRSCIILLEQLMKLSPEIKLHVKNEAMELAKAWITKMRVEPDHTLEVLGFLQLLASFKVADYFDPDELYNLLLSVAQHAQTPELFKVLGFGDKITGFIRKLVERKQHMEAIRFIYAFEQVKEFPPVPLLSSHLSHSKIEAKFKMGKNSSEEQKAARTKRIVALRDVLKCIEDHKLESEHLPQHLKIKNLNNSIAIFEKQNVSHSFTSRNANRNMRRCSVPKTPSQQHIRTKQPRVTETAGNASLGVTTTVSSMEIPSKHLNRSNQECKIDYKLPSPPPREQIKQEPNCGQLEQQDSDRKHYTATSAPAASSLPRENGSKRPRTSSPQMHNNLHGFRYKDFHTNQRCKGVRDSYSWDAFGRPW